MFHFQVRRLIYLFYVYSTSKISTSKTLRQKFLVDTVLLHYNHYKIEYCLSL